VDNFDRFTESGLKLYLVNFNSYQPPWSLPTQRLYAQTCLFEGSYLSTSYVTKCWSL
jgi:hypothetical protein